MLLVLLLGCSVYEKLFDLLEEPPVPPCDTRGAWWEDGDGDGHGNPADVWVSCEQPAGWVDVGDDCDDADPAVTTCDTGADTADTSGDTADTSGDTSNTPDTSDTSDPPDTSPRPADARR
ncbi:MAG: hypothetical protein ACK4YP_26560 [Myxococcota bacterium]